MCTMKVGWKATPERVIAPYVVSPIEIITRKRVVFLGTGGRRREVSNSQGSIQPITDSEEVV